MLMMRFLWNIVVEHCMLFKFILFSRLQLTDNVIFASNHWTGFPLYYSCLRCVFCQLLGKSLDAFYFLFLSLNSLEIHFTIWIENLKSYSWNGRDVVDRCINTVTVKCRKAIKVLLFYINVCQSVMVHYKSLSCSFTSITFLTIC